MKKLTMREFFTEELSFVPKATMSEEDNKVFDNKPGGKTYGTYRNVKTFENNIYNKYLKGQPYLPASKNGNLGFVFVKDGTICSARIKLESVTDYLKKEQS